MNYIKFTTDNATRLIVKSMQKKHTVTHLAFNKKGHDELYNKMGLIGVSVLPEQQDITLMAKAYQGDNQLSLCNKNSHLTPYLDMYIHTFDGKYFQVAAVFQDKNKANDFMEKRVDTALIDSAMSKQGELHFVASITPAFVHNKMRNAS